MNSTPNKLIKALAPALLLTLGVASCKKDKDDSYELVRNFMPGDISVNSGDTIASLSWRPSLYTAGKDISYTLDISKDSLFQGTPELSVVTKSTEVTVNDRQLAVKQKYFARLKANALDNSAESKWVYSTGAVPLKGEQIFLPVLDGELTENAVTLRWRLVHPISKITLTSAGGAKTEITITAAESAAGKKIITGLTPQTKYTAALFSGVAQKGDYTFTTFADLPTGANVVMVQPTDNLASMIAAATSGTTFVLLQGTKYNADAAILIPNNVSFTIWGQAGPNRPILSFNGLTLPATAGTIKFENLDITGYQNGDPALPKRNYIFNQSVASTTSEIIFENCIIRNLVNTPMRLQGVTTITIDKFTVNKCIVYDIGVNGSNGTYAFIHNTVASKINNISLTNNTFYNIGYGLVLHSSAPSVAVQVENNTFYNVTGDSRYMIDFNAQPIASSFTFTNNILGKTLSPAGTGRGVRSTATPPTLGGSTYRTSDATFSANPFSGIVEYAKSSTDLFTDPAAGNFLYKDLTFAGRGTCGDPRWRY
jgi:hypothetical protein